MFAGPGQLVGSAAFLLESDWKVRGSFSVDGALSNGSTCCASGKIKSVTFEETQAASLALKFGSFELALLGYQDVPGKSETLINICIDGATDYQEFGTVSVTLDWYLELMARASLMEANLGPITLHTGLELGVFSSSVEFGTGSTGSASFAVDNTVNSIGATLGTFIGLDFTLGGIHFRSVFDCGYQSVSHGPGPKSMYLASLGIGVGF